MPGVPTVPECTPRAAVFDWFFRFGMEATDRQTEFVTATYGDGSAETFTLGSSWLQRQSWRIKKMSVETWTGL